MAQQAGLKPLTEIEFFADVDRRTVDRVLAAAKPRHVAAKQEILAMGEPATNFFLLESGRAQYYRVSESGTEISLCVLTQGNVLGLSALLKQKMACPASAAAVTDCDLLVWTKATMRGLVAKHPQLMENALRIALAYLKRYMERHLNVMTKTAEQRLAITLLDLARRMGRARPEGIEIETTNEQISCLADITRFTTSRLLKNFERSGVVSKRRGKVVIHSPEALAIG
jgi:CRP-like cAMP-binding protein